VTDAPAPAPPSATDPLVRRLTGFLGGPTGRFALLRADSRAPVIAMILAVTVVSALGIWQKSSCYQMAWDRAGPTPHGPDDYIFTHTCYSDIALLYRERGFQFGAMPYFDKGMSYPALEYPVLTGMVMYAMSTLTRLFGSSDAMADSVRFFAFNAVLMWGLSLLVGWSLIRLAPNRPWDAMLFATAPALALTATINWDLVVVAMTGVAMVFWARRHPALAGVMLGLGAATKLYSVFLLGPLLVLGLRTGRLREVVKATVAALAAWAVINLPFILGAYPGWREFFDYNNKRPADFGSIWLVLVEAGHPVRRLNQVSLALFLLGCAFVLALGLLAPVRPRLPQLAFLVVAAFLLVNKVYSPQYVLWLLPLAVLAHPRVRNVLIWQSFEILYWLGVWMYLAGIFNGHPIGRLYWLVTIARMAAELWFCGLVVRDVLAPRYDPVRAPQAGLEVDDPAGGVFDGAADMPWRRSMSWAGSGAG
jgi:uncharacterized membrane protein